LCIFIGWCFVERDRDGARGWMPTSALIELESSHVRAKNFKRRHAVLKLISAESAAAAATTTAAAAAISAAAEA